jgi:desulfoferrodoxin-like iron-binding protein
MIRKIYQCQVCGSMIEVLSQRAGGFSCCGAPLTFLGESRLNAHREKQVPPIDLIEVMVDGNSCWQFLSAWRGPDGLGRVTRAGWRK